VLLAGFVVSLIAGFSLASLDGYDPDASQPARRRLLQN
jgi:hypothetical protein